MSDAGLIAFLTARLDEKESAAKAAKPGQWTPHAEPLRGWRVLDGPDWTTATLVAWSPGSMGPGPLRGEATATHIAIHSPARTLREVEAGRALIKRYERACTLPEPTVRFTAGQDDGYRQACLDAIRDLAAVHGDHRDYRPEWAPDGD